MRSPHSALALALVLAAAVVAGCDVGVPPDDPGPGSDHVDPPPPGVCEVSFLNYDNFGEPFIANWCRGCHSSDVPANMRQMAPKTVNFDSVADVRTWSAKIATKAGG